MPNISQRALNVPLSPIRKLAGSAELAKAKGRHVFHLNIGQPDIATPEAAMARLREVDIKVLEYSPTEGWASTRAAFAKAMGKFGVNVSKEEVMVTTGASEGNQLLFFACFDKGDEVIIPEPFYANYNGFAQIADVVVRPVTSTLETGFAMPQIQDFERVINSRTRAIFLNNPSNPTGAFYPRALIEQLALLVKQYDLYLIVDEVYRDFCYDGQEFFSVLRLEEMEENVIVLDSISKKFSACGARIGTIITRNQDVMVAVSNYGKLRLSPPAFGQFLSEFLCELDDEYMDNVREEYHLRRDLVYERLSKMQGVVSYKPGGAFYCFAKFPVENADHFCQWMLEEFEYNGATVMLAPGEAFYATPGLGIDEVRIAYVLNTTALNQAMDCLEQALAVYPYKKVRDMASVL
ncbi:pyridoxal phosphate-dependent aminotransferase [Haliscomenobacter sp.]|uniref:pyridoxal phosphate-dependent aminotransferase n=1 Tax=Haliscomenobacter sp. TaxID=2717303 RepID=UPI003364E0BE